MDAETTRGASAADRAAALPSDPARLEALIDARRQALASTIDELVVKGHPKAIAQRSAEDLKGRAQAFVAAPDGGLRTERLAALAAAGVAVLATLVALRRRARRRRRAR